MSTGRSYSDHNLWHRKQTMIIAAAIAATWLALCAFSALKFARA